MNQLCQEYMKPHRNLNETAVTLPKSVAFNHVCRCSVREYTPVSPLCTLDHYSSMLLCTHLVPC